MINNNVQIVTVNSTRAFGSMMSNRVLQVAAIKDFLNMHKLPYERSYFMKQIHGADIAYVDDTTNRVTEGVDGLVSDKKGLYLGVVTADCVPVSLYDKEAHVVGVAHAGYKGLLSGVVSNLIKSAQDLGAEIERVKISIGACIGPCCYDIYEDRAMKFVNLYTDKVLHYKNNKIFLDLPKVVQCIALKEGILVDNIKNNGVCTACNNATYYSYRKDSKETFGEFMTVVGISE